MNDRNNQDYSTRRFSTDGFDCTPPPGAMDELLRPKRARMFRPPDPPVKPSRLEEARKVVNMAMFLAMGIAFIFAMLAIANYCTGRRETVAPAPIISPTPAVVRPTSRPVPTPTLVPVTPVRRAELAVKRAALVGLPIGWQGQETMPDGSTLPVRYMGEVGYFDHLPRNPTLGDMWKVTSSGAAWVWTTPANFSVPAWVDP
jgi:hypothetical protein